MFACPDVSIGSGICLPLIEDRPEGWLLALGAFALVLNVSFGALGGISCSTLARQSCAWVLCGGAALWVTCVVFGAPVWRPITLLWALSQSCISVLPLGLFVALPPPSSRTAGDGAGGDKNGSGGGSVAHFLLFPGTWLSVSPASFPGLLALLGSWGGAVVVPLDWGQKWQIWPASHIYGCVGAWVAGAAIAALYVAGAAALRCCCVSLKRKTS